LTTFRLRGGKTHCFKALNKLQTIRISNNLGDAKSLICHPDTTTHAKVAPEEKQRLGIGPNMLRLSVGLEAADDIIGDLENALR
ncbi:MAG: PLP-dependent transferase, partial [Rhodospirillales bacterium]